MESLRFRQSQSVVVAEVLVAMGASVQLTMVEVAVVSHTELSQ
jgi:hypothetical protein